MDIHVKQGELHRLPSELAVVGLYEGQAALPGAAQAFDGVLGGMIGRVLAQGDFSGKIKECVLLYSGEAALVKRVLLVGLGKESKVSLESIRVAAGTAARRIMELGVKDFATEVFGLGQNGIGLADAVQALVEGAELAVYQFVELKTDPEARNKQLHGMTVLLPDESRLAEAEGAVRTGQAIVKGVYLARDLVNWPANIATPTFLAEKSKEMAAQYHLDCTVLDEAQMEDLGMHALLAVSKGSEEPAKFIILDYNAGHEGLDTIVLVGKGVTFDSGGLNIKTDDSIVRMKSDMAGGAAVIGAIQAAAALQLPLHVVGLVPSSENMPSGKAFKPGDVVRSMSGKTIEVVNTDSEGRMLLADALCYAARYQARAVLDIATLTGARTIALGDHAIGLFSKHDELIQRLQTAGQKSHERVWAYPMWDEYGDSLTSFVADFKHEGARFASSIIAAIFLSKFVDYPWAHLDIAGMVSTENERPYTPKWATGIGVRLFVQFLRDWVASAK